MFIYRFAYCDTANTTNNNVSALLSPSKKYIFPQLSQQCKEFLQKNINVVNVLSILDQRIIYEKKNLSRNA